MTSTPSLVADTTTLLNRGPVIPVVVLDDAARAVPLARALLAGGIDTMEITLRTATALDSIRAVADQVPEMAVGAGTVTSVAQLDRAVDAGATFVVTPGATPTLVEAGLDSGIPFLPGAVTASEVVALLEHGVETMKFFPAASSGGPAALRALGGPFPQVRFCPTGGIGPGDASDYLALANVDCVGGSWIAPADLVAAEDWDRISALCRATRELRIVG
ncbi:bifunctional 4-hydroxy-2-oxoglutarate aldolase/2-dehydro-3-deoxy-phosphogluconate aldolase [Gordonia sp. 'Campus']|uniref:bifunctional 4-hydroxy-2-oxoglutarate aldolase/2-dehydro-3-deoxy-phosphogluconate aldolase n=1 Tax=Gordonia sp. 'Campus' TaxID=2915824 RepID=UPI001EE425C8|nr:bifunctional 4-hydroxy-2-oxoglutarate aldolase/2-dehydro-3-deoxy-phosphogluconate aldolase [Gordonia sp. 'Campus']